MNPQLPTAQNPRKGRRPNPGHWQKIATAATVAALAPGLILAAPAGAAPEPDKNDSKSEQGPRGMKRNVGPDGKPRLDFAPDPLSAPAASGVTQPEPDTPLDKSKLVPLAVKGMTKTAEGITLDLGGKTGYIRLLAPDLAHIAVVEPGQPAPQSPAILKKDWAPVDFTLTETPKEYTLKAAELTVEVTKAPFGVRMRDAQGRILSEDDLTHGSGYESGKPYAFKKTKPGEHFYGFGEQSGELDKRGGSLGMWNTDAYAYTKDTKYLYTAIPFFMGLTNGQAYGMLFDNTHRTYFEMASENEGYYYFYANGGPLSYYFFSGPGMPEILERYTELTGRFKQPPQWSLGLHQSKWGYTEADLRNVAATYREKKIPLDVLHLDIDYMDAYRVFTWGDGSADPGDTNREHGGIIKDPKGFNDDLAAMGLHSIAINDPAVKKDPGYSIYDEGEALGAWAKNPDGTDFVGQVWPKDSKFPDFTREDVRNWWADKHNTLFDPGVDGIWLDMNEPAVFDGPYHTAPLDTLFNHGKQDHREVHNLYGFHETEATKLAFDKYKPGERPFILTRDMFAGSQRNAALWTGDNVSTWEHLKMSIPMNLNVGLSGVPMVGNDIGGFASRPDAELMARWIQVGAMLPFARIHYDSDAKAPVKQGQEPWAFGPEVEAISKRYIELRYKLLPYLSNVYATSAKTGSPVWQPLLYQFQGDRETYRINDEFMLGEDLLVAPVVEKGQTSRKVYLPKGTRWIDYWTGESHEGGQWIERAAALDTMPIFVREGTILPSREVQQHTDERPLTELTLDVWADKEASTVFREDDGKTLKYESGAYDATRLEVGRHGKTVSFTATDEHDGYDSKLNSFKLRFHESEQPATVVDAKTGAALPFEYKAAEKVLEVSVPAGAGQENVELRF